MKLACQGLGKTYRGGTGGRSAGEVVALEAVDMAVEEHEFVSIVGPSGCGKSTLFHILAGLLEPTRGRIWLDGRETRELLGRVGYMPQKDLLMPWRTVLDNVTLGPELRGVARGEARARAFAQLDRFGLLGFERRRPATLSVGMRQRAALLRTFLADRDLMLLDEPFAALDALTRQELQHWLLDVWQEDRKTILFVTHDVEEAVYLSDRVYVMSGRPGTMRLCLEVDLPRPRSLEAITSPEFVALKQRLLVPLRSPGRMGVEV
jgi:ABC-type nitrate/sulfonate/bicarbonate transport system ATPase subunit